MGPQAEEPVAPQELSPLADLSEHGGRDRFAVERLLARDLRMGEAVPSVSCSSQWTSSRTSYHPAVRNSMASSRERQAEDPPRAP